MHWRLFADLADVAGDRRVEVDGNPETVGDALDRLLKANADLADRVRADGGELAAHVTVLKNGEDVSSALESTVGPDDELALLPPVTGG